MDVDTYLLRIGDRGPREPSPGTLLRLHRAHMRTVPFENLDIPLQVPIELGIPALYDKIVERRRGGFCYELNGLFACLLEALGFKLVRLSARVYSDGRPGPDFAHMLLLVDLDGPWIADVGFGDSFIEPLRLDESERHQDGISYRLREIGAAWILYQRLPDADWVAQYGFSLTPRRLGEFRPMCHYHQTSPDSTFTRKSVCSRATADGRVTVANGRLIVTSGGEREERPVVDEHEYRSLLAERFGIELDPDAAVERLLSRPDDAARS